jgi:pentatricopeptide repeat protein
MNFRLVLLFAIFGPAEAFVLGKRQLRNTRRYHHETLLLVNNNNNNNNNDNGVVNTPPLPYLYFRDVKIANIVKDFRIQLPQEMVQTISTQSLNFILYKLASSGRAMSGQKAEQILRYMLERPEQSEIQPDTVSLNSVLSAYCKAGVNYRALRNGNAEACKRLFREWQALYQKGLVKQDVDKFSYNTLISCLAKANMPLQAEEFYRAMQAEFERTRNVDLQPDAHTVASLLHSFAISGDCSKVGALFQQLQEKGLTTSIHSYNEVLYAYSKSNNPSAATEFLQWWTEEDQGLARPDTRSRNIVMHALTRDKDSNATQRAEKLFRSIERPDSVSYTTLASLYAKLPAPKALQAINATIKGALRDPNIQVDAKFLSNILYTIATCSDDSTMPFFAESVVRNLNAQNIHSNVHVYNALLHCWACSNHREAPSRVLRHLETLEADKLIWPNVKTYAIVLSALKRQRDSETLNIAENIIQKMEKRGPKPNAQVYSSMIQIYARSRLATKARRAYLILERMQQSKSQRLQPTIVTYNLVLNACEHMEHGNEIYMEEALKSAFLTFDSIRHSNVRANHITYATFLGVLASLMAESARQQIVELVFRRCCMEGLVSKLVLKKLQSAAGSQERFQELMRGHTEDRLPERWCFNVREQRARKEI